MNTPYTLTELCAQISEALEMSLAPTYWVRAEVSSLTARGHCYMELIEKGADQQIAARVRATCWQTTWRMLSAYFQTETGQSLSVGMQILVEVEVSFHAAYGLSLNIRNIDPQYTLGDLARQRQETIAQLEQEGLMERQPSLELPTLVRRLAVISSDSAAGYQDFVCQLLHEASETAVFRITSELYPAVMQGNGAESSILSALQAIEAKKGLYDAVIIIRGGGATTDLSCFDSYMLCRAIALFPLPILSGIGHTRDVSVLDMVCHMALKTPTAVASFLNDRMVTQWQRVADWRRRLSETAKRQVMIRRHRLELLADRIRICSPERIYKQGYSLLTVDGKIVRSVAEVQKGMKLLTHLQDGEIQSVAE